MLKKLYLINILLKKINIFKRDAYNTLDISVKAHWNTWMIHIIRHKINDQKYGRITFEELQVQENF